LGTGLWNAQSQIVFRRVSRAQLGPAGMDAAFFRERLRMALKRRELAGATRPARRLVWSESDGLPGLVVDQYGGVLVLQALTLGMAQRQETVVEVLKEVLEPEVILGRNDAPVREHEGLPREVETLHGTVPAAVALSLDGLDWELDLRGGHKTGFYLDQLDNYAALARIVRARGVQRVLDVFCNQGGFALAAARAGARQVEAVDQSAEAIARAKANAQRNGLEIAWSVDNAFDHLRRLEEAGRRYELVVLDPPSFARGKKQVEAALRGYKELHLRAIRLLEPGGYLGTFCCSHHVSGLDWRELCGNVAADTGVSLLMVERLPQPPDHPVLVEVPETEYLQGYVLEKN
ncbi:MAG: class I SAM-dependent rRNA methyltransferase, partial [Verrucomicrobiota bacterium]